MRTLAVLLVSLAAARGDAVIAKVNGTAITGDAFARRLEELRSRGGSASGEAVLEGLIAEEVLSSEARKLGITDTAISAQIDGELRRAAADAFLAELEARAQPDDKMLRQLFHATADAASFESLTYETRQDAEAALQRIQKGATLAAEAKSAIVSRTFAKPADAPLVPRASLAPQIAAALFSSTQAGLLGPIDTGAGWMLVRRIDMKIGSDQEFGARRPSLVQFAKKQLAQQARRHLIEKRKASGNVSVDEDFLRKLDKIDASAADLDHVIANVAGTPVRYRDIYGSVRSVGRGGGHMAGPTVKVQLAWREVEERIFGLIAQDEGFVNAPAVAARRPEITRVALATAAAERIRASTPPPGEDEISAYYRRNASRYAKPFAQVLPLVVADAAAEKRQSALLARVRDLRARASVKVDKDALARAAGGNRDRK